MARVGRPELYPVKKLIGFDGEMLGAIERWRRRQTPVPSVSDAIRHLVDRGLSSEGDATKPRAKRGVTGL
jgi:hypothetical protein